MFQVLSACLVLFCILHPTHTQAQSWESIEPFMSPPMKFRNICDKSRSVLHQTDGTPITTAEQWNKRRSELLQEWHSMMGAWPQLITNPTVKVLNTLQFEDHQRLHIKFRWTPNEWTDGYLLIPLGKGPFPAVLTTYYEPETAIGQGKPLRDFALQLVRRGFVTLSIGTREASQAKQYSLYYPELNNAQVQPLSMLAYAAANAWYVLATRDDVDAKRIGIVGHSFGGKWAMFASCLFDRFACAVWSDSGILFDETRPSINYWEPWYLGYHPQPWRKRALISTENPAYGLYPKLREQQRDLHELHALMAPRPFLVSGGSEDPPERWGSLNQTRKVYQLLKAENRVGMHNRPSHGPTAESNAVVYAFFEYYLKNN